MSTDRIRAAAASEVDKARARARQTIDDIDAAMKALDALDADHPAIAGRVLSIGTSPRVYMSLLIDDFIALTADVGGIGCASFEAHGRLCEGTVVWGGSTFTAVGDANEWAAHMVQVETETTVRVSLLT